MKTRVNKNTNTYCWLWSASEYEGIELNRKKFIEEKKKEFYKTKKKKIRRK